MNFLFYLRLLSFFYLFLFGCSVLGDYIDQQEEAIPTGWTDDHTFQFLALENWDNKKYYLNRYESPDGPNGERQPTRFAALRKKYNDFFRQKALDFASKKLGESIYAFNKEKNPQEWSALLFSRLEVANDLNILIIREEYYADGKVLYVMQLKKNGLRKFVECIIPGGTLC